GRLATLRGDECCLVRTAWIDECFVGHDLVYVRRHGPVEIAQGAACPTEPFHRSDQRSILLKLTADRFRAHTEMLREQCVPEGRDRPADGGIAGRFDRQVTLRIESHGTIAKICRSHAYDLIINDAHLAVHADALPVEIWNLGIVEIQAVKPV